MRCPHLLYPADLLLAAGGHAQALCGHVLPAEGFTITSSPSGALCLTRIADIPCQSNDPGPRGTQ